MALLHSAVPRNAGEMMLALSALLSPSASGSVGNYLDAADSGDTQLMNAWKHMQGTSGAECKGRFFLRFGFSSSL